MLVYELHGAAHHSSYLSHTVLNTAALSMRLPPSVPSKNTLITRPHIDTLIERLRSCAPTTEPES